MFIIFDPPCMYLLSLCSDEEEADGLEILMEAPEGFRNSDEDRFSESQVVKVSVEFFLKL